MSRKRNAEAFRSHLLAESTFASATLSKLAPLASYLAAEARRLGIPGAGGSSSSRLEDSEPERIADYFYFTRTGGAGSGGGGSCSLLRRKVSGLAGSEELVVDVAEIASSQGASSLGQIKLSPCGKAVVLTLDVGGGGEVWRAVVVEAGGGGGT